MNKIQVPWDVWKDRVDTYGSATRHMYNGGAQTNADHALMYAFTGNNQAIYVVSLRRDTDPASEWTDWDTNYKDDAEERATQDQALADLIGIPPVASDGSPIGADQRLTLGQARFVRTDDGSAAMNVNGLAAGADTVIWNGTGGGDTGGDWTPEAQGSETAGAMHSGTNGWDSGVRTAGQETRFDFGSNQDIAGSYDTLKFWMNPQAYPAGSDFRVFWRTAGGSNPGVKLSVENYVTNMDTGIWQQVEIPIADFNLGNDVAKIVFEYGAQGGQHFFLDDIEVTVTAAGGPYIFQVKAPDTTEQYHLTMAVLILVAPSADWLQGSFANIAGGLANGLLLRARRLSDGEVFWSLNSADNLDLFGRFHPQDDVTFADGALMMGFMVKPGAASVVITTDTVLEFVVRDDLSTVSNIRAFAHYGVEVVV